MKVAIPHFEGAVAPCFEYSATISIFTVREGRVARQEDFALQSQRPLDRVRLLRDQRVSTLICGGVQGKFEELIRASGIHVISWVSGRSEELLWSFIRGELVAEQTEPNVGAARPRERRRESDDR